jgi:hypothetical protein
MILKFRIGILFLLFLILLSCGKKEKIAVYPENFIADSIITETKMVCILADVHIVEAALLMERNEGVGTSTDPAFLYQGIFTKYHISKFRYEENLKYYSMNPALMVGIYDKVILLLAEQQKKFAPGEK